MKKTQSQQLEALQQATWQYYKTHSRDDLPWRQVDASGNLNPYHILVSEVMLQQTQVSRVVPKFQAFIAAFPTIEALATAPLAAVLTHWSGLGYNRRAQFLQQAAEQIHHDFGGQIPNSVSELTKLKGIGLNTAAAIAVYSFNEPVVFIETNIRTVFIHHCYPSEEKVSDTQLLPLIKKALDQDNAREWYWTLMDYGSYLKAAYKNPSRKSSHYTRQSTFEGSRRQVRGVILKTLMENGPLRVSEFAGFIDDERLEGVLSDLLSEGLISLKDDTYILGR